MKKPFLIICILTLILVLTTALSCFCQVQEFYVRPSQTDANYPAQDSHFVAYNTTTQNGKLLLFIGGTFSSPKNYDYITRYAAGLGFDAISLTFPNSVLTTLLAGSTDSLSFDKFRQEICFGTQISPAVAVDTLNSIYTRTLKLIQHMSQLSSHNWSQYLATPSTLDWRKIVVSGHSQGAGHACYLAKYYSVERVVMFSGPNDYSTYFSNSAHWLRETGITAMNKHFVFLHLQDEVVPFNQQFANITGLGMLQSDDTTLVDDISAPYTNSQCLYTNHAPGSSGKYHSSTVIYSATPLDANSNPLFAPLWEYMLTSSITTTVTDAAVEKQIFFVYPNPAAKSITIQLSNFSSEVFILNTLGQMITSENIRGQRAQIDLSRLSPGIYFLRCNETTTAIMKK